MAADAWTGSVVPPIRSLLARGGGWRGVARVCAACAAVALAHVVQRYCPALAGEPATRQLAFLKAMLLLPVLLSLDRFRGEPPGRSGSEG